MNDFCSLLFGAVGNRSASVNQYFAAPSRYKDLFGLPPIELVRAAAHFAETQRTIRFADAARLLEDIGDSVAIERLALRLRASLLGSLQVNGAAPGQEVDIWSVLVMLYSEYMKRTPQEVQPILSNVNGAGVLDAWKASFANDADVSPESVAAFYQKLEFPVGCRFAILAGEAINLAYYGLPLHLLDNNANGPMRVFDYGGNSGMLASAMATHPRVVESLLIEPRDNLCAFARWRDEKCGIRNVRYLSPEDVVANPPEPCGFGVCIEVLEHVFDVEGAVRNIANLLNPGGILFVQASFGNPHLTSLKRNATYAGREDELMRSAGLEPVQIPLPLRLLGNQRFYRKPQLAAAMPGWQNQGAQTAQSVTYSTCTNGNGA